MARAFMQLSNRWHHVSSRIAIHPAGGKCRMPVPIQVRKEVNARTCSGDRPGGPSTAAAMLSSAIRLAAGVVAWKWSRGGVTGPSASSASFAPSANTGPSASGTSFAPSASTSPSNQMTLSVASDVVATDACAQCDTGHLQHSWHTSNKKRGKHTL